MAERIMNLTQVARYLHLKAAEVSRMVKQGEIPFENTAANPVFRREEIDAWGSQRIMGMRSKPLWQFHRDTSRREELLGETPLIVCDLLTPERTVFGIESRTKASILRDMAAVAERENILYDPSDLVHSLEEREALCSTGMVGGVAIIHPRHHDPYITSEPFLILALAAHPIFFGAPDGKPTDVFFLLVADDDQHHLQALARLCMMMMNTDLLDNLRTANDATEMHQLACAAEQEVLGSIN